MNSRYTRICSTFMVLATIPVHGSSSECTDLDLSIPLPTFSMSLVERNDGDLDFELLAGHLIVITTSHMQTVFDAELMEYTEDANILKDIQLSVDLRDVIGNDYMIFADFAGQACFESTDFTGTLQTSGIFQSMAETSFSNDNYWLLLHEFQSNEVLSSMISKVDVFTHSGNIPVGSNSELEKKRSDRHDSGDGGMSKGSLSLVIVLMVAVLGVAVLSFVYLYDRKRARLTTAGKSSSADADSESSDSDADSDKAIPDEPTTDTETSIEPDKPIISYKSPESAMEAWSKASQEAPPKPKRLSRIPVRRQPSKEAAIKFSLSSITESDDELNSAVSTNSSLSTFVNSVNGFIFGALDRTAVTPSRKPPIGDHLEDNESLGIDLPPHLLTDV